MFCLKSNRNYDFLLVTPVRLTQLETLPARIATLKISERTDRSVSPQKQSKSTLDSPSVTTPTRRFSSCYITSK